MEEKEKQPDTEYRIHFLNFNNNIEMNHFAFRKKQLLFIMYLYQINRCKMKSQIFATFNLFIHIHVY